MELIHGGDIAGYRSQYGTEPLDFSANVSPLGVPDGVKKAIVRALDTAGQYPDPLCRNLRQAIGAFEDIDAAWVQCGNGAADLIFRLVLALQPKRGLVTAPTFGEYEQALSSVGCEVQRHSLLAKESFAVTPRLLEEITPKIDILFLCQPNNPTGQLCSTSLLLQVLEKCRECKTILVLDECFVSFLDEPQLYTMKGFLKQYPNLILLKAFTKLYAMAGIRLGYCLCADTSLLETMQACGQPWGVSSLAQAAGIAALSETEYVNRVRALVQEQRPLLADGLNRLGCQSIGSAANFIFFFCTYPHLDKVLRQKGIMIRSCSNYPGLSEQYYRVAVRTAEENNKLLKAIREVLA